MRRNQNASARLKAAFIQRVESSPHGWPGRKEFGKFFRVTLARRLRIESYWSPMTEGEAVPVELIEATIEFARRKWSWLDVSVETASEPATAVWNHDRPGGWRNWSEIFRIITAQLIDSDDMRCHRPTIELPATAVDIMKHVGRMCSGQGGPRAEEAWLRRGQEEMKRTPEEFAAWLDRMWETQPRCVMFPVCYVPSGSATNKVPVGASLVLSLKENAFHRFANGELSDLELTPTDLQSPSRYLFLHSLIEPADLNGLTLKEVTQAQARCMFCQMAYFTRSWRKRTGAPVVVSIGGTPVAEDRLARFGYRRNGKNLHGWDNKPILLLQPPRERRYRCKFEKKTPYWFMRFMFFLVRQANRKQWRREDREAERL